MFTYPAVWSKNDNEGFFNAINANEGQINMNSSIGQLLYNIAADTTNKTFLEIGTWNGLGSTRCFIEGFKNRTDDYVFYSLECNEEKHLFAKNIYKNMSNVHILNEVILQDIPDNICDIFPVLRNNEMYQEWNKIDFQNMRDKPLFLNRPDIPKIFDVLFLDGGEFTTWFEYEKLKDRCRKIILDDVNSFKCRRIKEDLLMTGNWRLVAGSNERNGYAYFEKY